MTLTKKSNKIKPERQRLDKITIAFILCFTILPWLYWLVFYVYVNLSSVVMAFQNSRGEFTLSNFKRFFEEIQLPSSDIRLALKNTLITFAINFCVYPLRVLVPYFIYKKVPFAGAYRIIFFLPAMIFGVAVSMVFTSFVGVNGFLAKGIGEWLGLEYVPELLANSRFANYTIWAHMLWLGFPGTLIIWGGTFARIPSELLEAGQIDGVNWVSEFTRIIVPLVWPTIALQMLLSICGILGASGEVFLLTNGDYGTITLNVWMFKQTLAGAGNPNAPVFNYLSAVGIIMTLVAVTLTFVIRRYTEKAFDGVEY